MKLPESEVWLPSTGNKPMNHLVSTRRHRSTGWVEKQGVVGVKTPQNQGWGRLLVLEFLRSDEFRSPAIWINEFYGAPWRAPLKRGSHGEPRGALGGLRRSLGKFR